MQQKVKNEYPALDATTFYHAFFLFDREKADDKAKKEKIREKESERPELKKMKRTEKLKCLYVERMFARVYMRARLRVTYKKTAKKSVQHLSLTKVHM